MKLVRVAGKKGFREFAAFGVQVYDDTPQFRGTQASVEKLVLLGPTAFHDHAQVLLFLAHHSGEVRARFALIHDRRLPRYVQVAFFEARPDLGDLWKLIGAQAAQCFPEVSRCVVGVNGHINSSAAFLMNRFDEPPVFGLPYTPEYYPQYFHSLRPRPLVSFRFTLEEIVAWASQHESLPRMNKITLRFMDKKRIDRDIISYNELNNRSFQDHPLWADRTAEEDLELFLPFRHLLDNENLIFAEHDGRPVAFYLWYPDFNQLLKGSRDLGLRDLLKWKIRRRIDTMRFTQIGILPEYRRLPLSLAMIRKSLLAVAQNGHEFCEGGFIFEENRASMALVNRILRRSFGRKVEPYRRYAVFEGPLK